MARPNARLRLIRVLVIPIAFLALASDHIYPDGSLTEILLGALGLALLLLAAGGRIWASVYLHGRKRQELVTKCPFSLVRNPLYLFSFLGFIGAGLSFGSLTLAAALGLTFFIAHWPAIRREEGDLEELFGEEYRAYQARVPRFFPNTLRSDSSETVSLDARGFSYALRDCLSIPTVFIVAQLVEWAKDSGVLPILFHVP
jgi:protein-S-isoprenylcysteine O-methyltransferase Ste14